MKKWPLTESTTREKGTGVKDKNWFQLYELLPKALYLKLYPLHGERLWGMFDRRYRFTINAIRRRYGKMIANTWHWGGKHQYRGVRPLDCEVGALLSQHKFFRAIDLVPAAESVENIRADIIADRYPEDFKYITAVEIGVPWLHIDGRERDKKQHGVLQFKA